MTKSTFRMFSFLGTQTVKMGAARKSRKKNSPCSLVVAQHERMRTSIITLLKKSKKFPLIRVVVTAVFQYILLVLRMIFGSRSTISFRVKFLSFSVETLWTPQHDIKIQMNLVKGMKLGSSYESTSSLQIMYYNNSHATGISVKSTDFSHYIPCTYYQIVCSYTKL